MGIKVKALQAGFYDAVRRKPGDIFEIKDEKERGKWMGEVDAEIEKPEEKRPFTSVVKGTTSGGNIFSPPGGREPWEEPVGESKLKPMPEYDAPEPTKKKSGSKAKKSKK